MTLFVLKLISIFLLSAFVVRSHASPQNPVVQTTTGLIEGSFMLTRLNKTINAFRGVRFAEPPVGEKRFKNPEPIRAWSEIFDATKEGPGCPTPTVKFSHEDCLRLNVYSTELPTSTNKVKRPVIVFFHPGGFYGYSGQSSMFGPQYFLDQDIVLVTVNYRLGTLGWISTGDARAPGNLGLKDQVIALRWIQNNIQAFGGDPASVTITGLSAGASSVALHMMSPMSEGLFHRIISASGAPSTPGPIPGHQRHLVLKQAGFVGCPDDDLDRAIECLKTVPYEQLGNSLPKFAEWYGDPVLIWQPVVEPEIPGVERFLTAQPVDLLRTKNFHHVPVIVGITRDEFSSAPLPAYIQAVDGDETIYKNITDRWEFAAPISFTYERDTVRSKYISGELKKFYFNDEPITVNNGLKLGLVYADSLIGFPSHRFAQLVSKYSDAPVYQYQFAYQGRFSFANWPNGSAYGVVHHDDMQYLFYMSFIFPFLNSTDPEVEMVEKMTAMWTNFARTGEPIPKNDDNFKGVIWSTMNSEQDNYLEIKNEWTMKSKMYEDRYALWDRLFPLGPIPT